MTNEYIVAFETGQKAAERLRCTRQEIASVLVEFERQVCEASGGRVYVGFAVGVPGNRFSSIQDLLRGLDEPGQHIAAQNPRVPNGRTVSLAEWKMHEDGYPCKISWGREERYCEDKEALMASLKDLLADPRIADRLHAVMVMDELDQQSPPSPDAQGTGTNPESAPVKG